MKWVDRLEVASGPGEPLGERVARNGLRPNPFLSGTTAWDPNRMGDLPCFAHLLDDKGRMPERPRVQIRRVYEAGPPDQGEIRVLVDRVWPRGVRKDSLALDRWAKEVAPSAELRRWFAYDPRKWPKFQRRYREELVARTPELKALALLARGGLWGGKSPSAWTKSTFAPLHPQIVD